MNITTSEIAAFLPELQSALKRLAKLGSKLAAAQSDRETFLQKISAAEDGDYNDVTAIEKLGLARRQLKLCEAAIVKFEELQGETVQPLVPLICAGARLVSGVLMPIYENRLETISACLCPFSSDKAHAVILARQTGSAQAAFASICGYSQLPQFIGPFSSPEQIRAAAAKIEAVLSESQKRAPDLLRFLDPVAAQVVPPAGVESDAPKTVASPIGGTQ
jgi:hypothetical protein